jgi:hypothetical protein
MKTLALVAGLMVLSAGAHAEVYVSGKNRVVIPSGCASWSCVSVSVPGHYHHNDRPARAAHGKSQHHGSARGAR